MDEYKDSKTRKNPQHATLLSDESRNRSRQTISFRDLNSNQSPMSPQMEYTIPTEFKPSPNDSSPFYQDL